jgi:hypothetical protein
MQAASQRELENSVGSVDRQGSETPEPENQQLNCEYWDLGGCDGAREYGGMLLQG